MKKMHVSGHSVCDNIDYWEVKLCGKMRMKEIQEWKECMWVDTVCVIILIIEKSNFTPIEWVCYETNKCCDFCFVLIF
jgi:hypothetical protein